MRIAVCALTTRSFWRWQKRRRFAELHSMTKVCLAYAKTKTNMLWKCFGHFSSASFWSWYAQHMWICSAFVFWCILKTKCFFRGRVRGRAVRGEPCDFARHRTTSKLTGLGRVKTQSDFAFFCVVEQDLPPCVFCFKRHLLWMASWFCRCVGNVDS